MVVQWRTQGLSAGPAWLSVINSVCSMHGTHCRVDLVLVGAEAVVENGGIINKLGVCARDVPVCCVVCVQRTCREASG